MVHHRCWKTCYYILLDNNHFSPITYIKRFQNVKSFCCKCQKAFVNPTSFIDHDCETHEHEALDNHEHGRDSGDDSGVDDDEANDVSVNGMGNDKKPLTNPLETATMLKRELILNLQKEKPTFFNRRMKLPNKSIMLMII